MDITFGSVCSGVSCASEAWAPLGWKADWFSEIDKFPSAVLAYRHPGTPNLGDMKHVKDMVNMGISPAPAVLTGGTPCQSFSLAGLRKSLEDERGALSLEFILLANEIDNARHAEGKDSAIILWENVPGVLRTKDNAFGCFLSGLAGCDIPLVCPGNGWPDAGWVNGPRRRIAWRVLNSQHFGVPQRRRRVYVVSSAREGFRPWEVLFEQKSLRGDSQETDSEEDFSSCSGKNTEESDCWWNGNTVSQTLDAVLHKKQCLPEKSRFPVVKVKTEHGVRLRYITPTEAERLQGFPDNHTAVNWRGAPPSSCPDGPRYKVMGNTASVPVLGWIGRRIEKEIIDGCS